MKRTITTLLCLVVGISLYAQLPKWVLTPGYDQLTVKVDNCLLQTDSAGICALWTMDGKCLFKTEHIIQPFKDSIALVTTKTQDQIVGIVNIFGKFTPLSDKPMVAFGHPYFEDNFLLCVNSDVYEYYRKDGSKVNLTRTVRSYPFHHGYAPYFTFAQRDKRKEPYYGYYRSDWKQMKYYILEKGPSLKELDRKSIRFLSGVGNDGHSVAVIKDKLYLFDLNSGYFVPFLVDGIEPEKKRHLTLLEDDENYFTELPDGDFEIKAKYGKNHLAFLKFNRELCPSVFTIDGKEQIFKEEKPKEVQYESDIEAYGVIDEYGIAMKSKEVLPKQFEKVGLLYDNKAFVKLNGKWGIISIIPDLNYSLKLNKGQDVAFRHHTFETQIRLDLPAQISATDARIDLPASSGCVLDKISRETKNTESGNYVAYNCSLIIPEFLPDTMTQIRYSPISISYDGISLFDTKIDMKAWHLKYYNVDPVESETTISNGVVEFTININVQKNVGENDYPFDVKIEADSVIVDCHKISETRYKCIASNLQEGNNSLDIYVTEKGCPSSMFPFEIYYTKPVPKKKEQEKAVVRKKSPANLNQPVIRVDLTEL